MTNTQALIAVILIMGFLFLYREISSKLAAYKLRRRLEEEKIEAVAMKAAEDRKAEEREWKQRWADLSASMSTLSSAVESLTESNAEVSMRLETNAEKLAANAASSTDTAKLLEGTIKACESIAHSTVDLRDQVALFSKLISDPRQDMSYPKDQLLKPNTDEEAEIVHNTFEKALRGIPLQQAVQEATEEAEKKMMYSVVSLGPEE